MKRMSLVAMALLSLMMMVVTAPGALAEEDPSAWPEWTCTTFPGTVAEAHAYFAENGGPATLDLDGDGVGCELGEDYAVGEGGGSAWPDWTCDDFPGGVDAAITQYETYGAPVSLDPDTDGTACEPGEDYAATGDGSTDSEDDTAAEVDESAASEDAEPAAVTSGASTTTSDAAIVSDLPVAGSGLGLPTPPGSDISLLLALSLIFGASAVHGNRLLRR